jgi:hypothetical protein
MSQILCIFQIHLKLDSQVTLFSVKIETRSFTGSLIILNGGTTRDNNAELTHSCFALYIVYLENHINLNILSTIKSDISVFLFNKMSFSASTHIQSKVSDVVKNTKFLNHSLNSFLSQFLYQSLIFQKTSLLKVSICFIE